MLTSNNRQQRLIIEKISRIYKRYRLNSKYLQKVSIKYRSTYNESMAL